MNKVVIVAAKRLPIGKFGGSLKDIKAPVLGSKAIEGVLSSVNFPAEDVELVIMGTVLQAGQGQNPARQAAMGANIPKEVPSFTINEVCGSGLKAIHLGAQAIMLGEQDVVMVGGFENMSQSPYLIRNARFGAKYNNLVQEDVLYQDGLMDVYSKEPMGITAENLARQYKISRETQDAYALLSQRRAKEGIESGYFKSEIIPVETKTGVFVHDEGIRLDTTLAKLIKLKPAFKENGSVTAGNSSTFNDGAAALLMMSEKEAKRRRMKVLAYVEGYNEVGIDPQVMGYAPYYAINNLLDKQKMKIDDI
ncbi:MAG TPA: acetyl-CoA C-acyltransferase, partial [Erysipelothrix sp.]|nr:acetyl-CoA C-acyltransferase [Erysipelothrix sp.]